MTERLGERFVLFDPDNALRDRDVGLGIRAAVEAGVQMLELEHTALGVLVANALFVGRGLRALEKTDALFDLGLEIQDLPPGEYSIEMSGPLAELEFTVDLLSSPSGSYCVEREQYPWGL